MSHDNADSFRRSLHYGSAGFGYSCALALALACGAARLAFIGPHERIAPFVFFYPGIALAAFLGGAAPGLAVAAGAALFGIFIFPAQPALASWVALVALSLALSFSFAQVRAIRDRSAAVAEESARLRFVMERVSDWLFLVGEDDRIQYVNQSALSQLGYVVGEVRGMPVQVLESGGARALAELVAKSRAVAVPPADIALRRRDGSEVPAEVSCTAIRTGQTLVVHVAARDIAERRELDRKLREASQWESLGALTGGLAHDFNNLLTSIMGNTSLAREMLPPDSRVAPLLEAAENAGERCAELIRMMLATAGYRQRHQEPLRPDLIARETSALKSLPAGISFDLRTEECRLMSDPGTITTLIRALIFNAAEAYEGGPGTVRVEVRSGPVPALGEASFLEGEPAPGTCVGIAVEDKGCGMAREVLDRAFQPFFTTRFTGRGLGLPAVRGIVRAHSGLLWLRTQPGAGTRVEVWLPASGYHQSARTGAQV